ncbi:hypothetical protein LSTR_LSTR011897 [Laodelphax striatellus]|uniref:G-protein coupled receptors family 1 profile domain-containing protein n=1 Tax=Laodelphax striatellus TaxID=195883 RepID=A0A482XLW3_LAOST|nr:hypothetical protein LSTR_LSTR011897 [Laodelphax striatellus]
MVQGGGEGGKKGEVGKGVGGEGREGKEEEGGGEGNVFVIAAILLERNLQNVANYLIVSLAVADLMVACLVMPLGAVYEISRGWILGPELCDMWTSSDVLCCTASILHLVAIAVDRYWAVTNVDYIHTRNGSRIVTMIVVVWSVALVVSLAPQFGWKDPDYLDRINIQQRCLVSQDIGYQIFATCSTFYVPLLVILVLYWKIFQTARKRIRRRRAQRNALIEANKAKETGDDGQTKGRGKRTLHFITKRRFLRSSRSKSDNQQASLALVEGQSSTEVLAEEEVINNNATSILKHSSPPTLTPAVTSSSLSHAHLPPPPSLGSAPFPPPSPSPSPLPSHTAHHTKRDQKKESLEAKRERGEEEEEEKEKQGKKEKTEEKEKEENKEKQGKKEKTEEKEKEENKEKQGKKEKTEEKKGLGEEEKGRMEKIEKKMKKTEKKMKKTEKEMEMKKKEKKKVKKKEEVGGGG